MWHLFFLIFSSLLNFAAMEPEDFEIWFEHEFDEMVKKKYDDDKSNYRWAHAINRKNALVDAIKSYDYDMIEADVLMGNLKGCAGEKIPIMAHPPAKTSDISFRHFISIAVRQWCEKPIKLDFKDILAVNPAIQIIKEYGRSIWFPIWINADVLVGTHAESLQSSEVVNPRELLRQLRNHKYHPAVLSLGWTTSYDSIAQYTWDDVADMAELLISEKVDCPLTFPVRASYVGRSINQLQWLLSMFPKSTLTVWNAEIDKPDLEGLVAVRKSISPNKVYYDLQGPLKSQFTKQTFHVFYASKPTVSFAPGTKFPLSSTTPTAIYNAPLGVILTKDPALYMLSTVHDLGFHKNFSLSGYIEVFTRNRTTEYIDKKFGLVLLREVKQPPTTINSAVEMSIFTITLKGSMNVPVKFHYFFDTSPKVTVEPQSPLPDQLHYSVNTIPNLATGNCTYLLGVWNSGGKGDVVFHNVQEFNAAGMLSTSFCFSTFLAVLAMARSLYFT